MSMATPGSIEPCLQMQRRATITVMLSLLSVGATDVGVDSLCTCQASACGRAEHRAGA